MSSLESYPVRTHRRRKIPSGAIRARLALLAFIIVVAVAVTSSPGLAQAPSGPSPAGTPSEPDGATVESSENPSEVRGPTDAREVEAFMDGFFAQQMEAYRIPGATVSVVKDGEVLFAKGYGQADVEANEPVVADQTSFQIASVTKLFTATAAMQLAERGKLDLDRDVNAYLDDVEIPDTYPGQPVTMRHLLTHTAGFEEHFTGSLARDAADVEPLGRHLSEQTPARVRPPGEITSYSNYGMALAGYIVQEVSGTPYESYLEKNVLAPLGMESTTAVQPPADELRKRLAVGYDVEGVEPVAGPIEYADVAPAGSASTTATDMANFMIVHLQDGRYGDARILEESTAREMRERQFANDPRLDSMGYGFYQESLNGERIVEHGGNLVRSHALVALLPERDVGVFVAYNSYGAGGERAEYELLQAFLDHYYPEAPPETAVPAAGASPENAERVAGSYRITRSNETGLEKAFTLLTRAGVTANEDGSITTTGMPLQDDLKETEQRWVEVEPLLFEAEGSDERIAFREDNEGRITYMAGDSDPTSAYEKVPAYENPSLHLGFLAASLIMMLLTALAWPAAALISGLYGKRYRRLYGISVEKEGRGTGATRLARVVAWGVCVLDLLFVVGMAFVFSNLEETLGFGASPLLISVFTLPILATILTVGVVPFAVLAWRRGYWGRLGRLHYSLVALSAVIFVALLGYYNLIGFQF